jgi:hypothetical protein
MQILACLRIRSKRQHFAGTLKTAALNTSAAGSILDSIDALVRCHLFSDKTHFQRQPKTSVRAQIWLRLLKLAGQPPTGGR